MSENDDLALLIACVTAYRFTVLLLSHRRSQKTADRKAAEKASAS